VLTGQPMDPDLRTRTAVDSPDARHETTDQMFAKQLHTCDETDQLSLLGTAQDFELRPMALLMSAPLKLVPLTLVPLRFALLRSAPSNFREP
jgi:hypothetical protein